MRLRALSPIFDQVSAIDAGCSDTWWRLAAFKLGASCTSEPAQLVRRGVEVCEAEARAAIWWSPRDWWQRNQRAKRLALLQQLADTLSRHGDRNVRQAVEAVADSRDACVSANGDRLQHPACVQCSQAFANMKQILNAAGAGLEHIVRVNAFVTGGLLPAAMRGKNITAPVHICDWCESPQPSTIDRSFEAWQFAKRKELTVEWVACGRCDVQ